MEGSASYEVAEGPVVKVETAAKRRYPCAWVWGLGAVVVEVPGGLDPDVEAGTDRQWHDEALTTVSQPS